MKKRFIQVYHYCTAINSENCIVLKSFEMICIPFGSSSFGYLFPVLFAKVLGWGGLSWHGLSRFVYCHAGEFFFLKNLCYL